MGASASTNFNTPITEVVTLSGTLVSPNYTYDADIPPGTVTATWYFRSDGTVDKLDFGGTFQFQSATQWVIPNTYTRSYWFRGTASTGSAPNGSSNSLNTWHPSTSDVIWTWTASFGTRVGSIKVEIATDAAGTNIVATGYYGGDVDITP